MVTTQPRTDGPVIDLAATGPGMLASVGGKAANLGAAAAAELAVPAGFCVTTDAYRSSVDRIDGLADVAAELDGLPTEAAGKQESLAAEARRLIEGADPPESVRDAIVAAYERLGDEGGPVRVAVRSSATAEDLPFASFAGQQDTFLDISGADAVIEAVRRCWASLWTDRAVHYRAANGIGHRDVQIAVVVQRLVDAEVSGVLFTANPVTGKRTQQVVDAAPGLGEALVSGTVDADHYVLDGEQASGPEDGCLDTARLRELAALGTRLEEVFGSPQDAEWAYAADGTLWLLQSRPITTLYPLPATRRRGTRAYLSINAAQGVHRPLTPMGLSVMAMTGAGMWEMAGIEVDPDHGPEGFVHAGGRMFIDATAMLRSERMRAKLPARMAVQGQRVVNAVQRVLDDPRFAPLPGMPFRGRTIARMTARYAGPAVLTLVSTLLGPARARDRAYRDAAELERRTSPPDTELSTHERIRFLERLPRELLGQPMMDMILILFGGLGASGLPKALLGPDVEPGEVDATLRGMPHNPTTQMDLELWRLASNVGAEARQLLLETRPTELAAMYLAGRLPDIGLDGFLATYGRRTVAEIDVGVPRWAEDPSPVFAVIANYLRLTDPEQAPDRRFAQAAREAEQKITELVARARGDRPVRARIAGVLMRRAREVAGLRELPKFAALHGYWQVRRELLELGVELAARGLIDVAEDVMFLEFPEARAAYLRTGEHRDLRALVAERRADHERELRRRHVPVVLLSDGTEPEAELPARIDTDGALVGTPAAPGLVTAPARVIHDPSGARLEPGEILVAPSTDPGWTPLFLTAGGLVTEMGAPNSHGPTVAREYGIPAVIGIAGATERIRTGQTITVDAAAGTVRIVS